MLDKPDDKTCAGVLLSGIFSGGLVSMIVGALDGFTHMAAVGAAMLGFWALANYRYIIGSKRCDRDVVGRALSSAGRKFHDAMT